MFIIREGTAPLYSIARNAVLHMAYNIRIDVAPKPKPSDVRMAVPSLSCREFTSRARAS